MVKKMRKRKDLDRLIGNGRKHSRKKSGHILLRTDSQSSISSADTEQTNQMSVVKYKRTRCSSFLFYASICLSICTLILCCVLFGLITVLHTHVTQLSAEVNKASVSAKERTNEIQDIYSRLQTLQVYIHHLNLNMTKNSHYFKQTIMRLSALEKKYREFRNYETLLGSLSNVPSELKNLKKTAGEFSGAMKSFQNKMVSTDKKMASLMSRFTEVMKEKAVKLKAPQLKTSSPMDVQSDDLSRQLNILERNVSDLRQMILHLQGMQRPKIKSDSNNSSSFDFKREFDGIQRRLGIAEKRLLHLNYQFEHYFNQSGPTAPIPISTENRSAGIAKMNSTIQSNKEQIAALLRKQSTSKVVPSHVTEPSQSQSSQIDDSTVEQLNSTLIKFMKRLPKEKITLGFGVSSNATFSRKPLGHGVILTRDEYYKLRNFWAKASDSFVLSMQSKQRVDVLEKKFKKLKKQVVASIKNIRVLEAVGLKPTDRPVNKNRPEMEINVPIPVYTTPRNPNAPTPDPHLQLPWVKTARDAEINFLRWNRNGDDALSGDELDPAALRGFMGPYTPSIEQMMHFDVNRDKRLSKKEVLCLFGFIPWPCTGEPIRFTTAMPKAEGKNIRKERTTDIPQLNAPTTVKTPSPTIKATSSTRSAAGAKSSISPTFKTLITATPTSEHGTSRVTKTSKSNLSTTKIPALTPSTTIPDKVKIPEAQNNP